jgi:KDO2-lipid IV(A) lauroyltransferase
MSDLMKSIGFRAEALGWDAYQGLFRSLGLERASDVGARLLRTLGPKVSVHHVARVNMQIAFPEASERELDGLLDAMWDNFGRLVGEFPNTHRFDFSPGSDQVEVVGADILAELDRQGRPAVLVGGHFANWELMAAVIMRHLKDCRITYRHANNPLIDQRIIDQRKAYGINILAPKGGHGAKELMQALKSGASVALMNDQKMNDGVAAPFFGRDAMTAAGPARMALRYDCPLVPMNVVRKDGARFKVTIYEPLPKPAGQDAAAILETVTTINRFIEDRIREAPSQWFWVHRRFEKPLYKKATAEG